MQNGIYNYFLNGEPTGVSEAFDSKILPDGSKITTSTRDAKPFNTMITVETVEKNARFQNCKVSYQKDLDRIEATYDFSEKYIQVQRKINGEIVESKNLDLPMNSIFFPLMRCFQGQTILQVAKKKDFTTVIVPDIQNSTDFESMLRLTFDQRTAKFVKEEVITFYEPESVSIETNLYQYFGKHYDDNSRFWVNKDGLLVAYRFAQTKNKIWNIWLKS